MFLAWSLLAVKALADIAVIAHPEASVSNLTVQQAGNIFLGKTRQLRDGTTLIPLDQKSGTAVRDIFYRGATNKSASQLKAYWSRQVFTGQGQPPLSLSDNNQVKTLVANNPNMIGYIESSAVDDSVKVVLLLKDR